MYTTLIRDQNGLGFSIAGGKGCTPFKDNTEVFIILKLNFIIIITHTYDIYKCIYLGYFHIKNYRRWCC